MKWTRWSSWNKDDPRWKVNVLDNTSLSVEETTDALLAWANERSIRHTKSQSSHGVARLDPCG
jgi:hypothetical protein